MTEREIVIEEEDTNNKESNSSTDSLSSDGLEEQFNNIFQSKNHTLTSRRVEGQIEDVEVFDDYVRFKVEKLTDNSVITDNVKIPDPWNENSRLAQILDSYGYTEDDIERMKGDVVELKRSFRQWNVVGSSENQRKKSRTGKGLLVLWLFNILVLGPVYLLSTFIGSMIPFILFFILMSPVVLITLVGTAFYVIFKIFS